MWCSEVGRVGVVQRGRKGRCGAAWWGLVHINDTVAFRS